MGVALEPIYLGEDHAVKWGDSATNGAYAVGTGFLNSATVTYALKTAAGATIATGTCSYVAASNGNYRGTIESSALTALVLGALYTLEITLVQGSLDGFRRLHLEARYRGQT